MKKIECPLCDEKFNKLAGMYEHIEEDHQDNIPEGYDVQRYLYYIKTGKTHGSCVVCKKDTGWNESTGKYKRFCDNPKCKEAYRETFKKRMIGKYGKTTLLNDPEQQRKMLAHRHISGEYEWTDGTKKTYTGSYELDFLKMLDVFMNFDSDDVMSPSPHTYYYEYEGEKKFYIPDVFIPSLNLEIEIKDGGDNPNMHGKIVAVDKVKEKIKDNVMASQKDYGYIKIVNKNYDEFFKYLLDQKERTAGAKNINFGNIIRESMLSLVSEGAHDYKAMCMNAPVESSPEINDLLTHTINNGHHIWLSTDWHLWRFDKDNKCIVKNPNFDAIISCHYADVVNKNDVFIYLGDLADDEFADKDALRDTISNLKGIKILVKGNNDIFDDDFYKSCGFTYVTYKFMWEGILFSHMPIENEYRLNCHGHLHGKMEYWINYTNQVDVYTADNRPVDIFEVIKARHEYAKNITITVRENVVQEASTGRKRVNDKGEDIPEKCPKCGSKIGLYLKGEPVWLCSNDKCKAYYGTAPCNESLETILEASAGNLRDVDNYYDFERFVNGDTNILFITGLTGGNKTQIARDISSSFNSEYINLDIFSETNINNIIDGAYVGSGSKEYITAIREFADKKLSPNHEDPTKIEPLTKNQIIEFIKTLIKGLSPNKRYVIEGIYIYRYYDEIKDIIDKYPVIVSRQNFAETVKLLSKSTITNMSNIFNIIYDESEDSVDWINNEKKSLDTFVENIRADREDMPDAIYKQSHYPVYVCLMHSGTVLANAIQKVTGDEFSHASISFDPSLRAMYSFAKDRNDMSLKPGLIHEDIQSAFLHKPIPYSLYVTFVPRAEFKQMKRKLYEISKNAANYKYSMIGLVKYALGMAAETKNQMFCSEFVSTILNARTNRTDGLRPAEVKPETFKNLSKFQLVQKGVLTDYDMKATIARVRTMKK